MAKFTNPRDRGEVTDAPEQETATPAQAPVGLSQELLQAIAAISGMQSTQFADVLKQVVQQQAQSTAEVMKSARSRRPESYNGDVPYTYHSAFSPNGEKLPELKCDMFFGTWENDKHNPVYPIIADDTGGCTMEERLLLNALEPGVYSVMRRDRVTAKVRVVVDEEADGTPRRLTVAFPKEWMVKPEHLLMPDIVSWARQMVAEDVVKRAEESMRVKAVA